MLYSDDDSDSEDGGVKLTCGNDDNDDGIIIYGGVLWHPLLKADGIGKGEAFPEYGTFCAVS